MYKCFPNTLTWTLIYRLSIVIVHNDSAILVKPGEKRSPEIVSYIYKITLIDLGIQRMNKVYDAKEL